MSTTASAVRLRVAIYAADGSVRAIVTGVQNTIEANVPPGGSWAAVPSSVRKISDVRRAAGAPSVGFAASFPKGGASEH